MATLTNAKARNIASHWHDGTASSALRSFTNYEPMTPADAGRIVSEVKALLSWVTTPAFRDDLESLASYVSRTPGWMQY